MKGEQATGAKEKREGEMMNVTGGNARMKLGKENEKEVMKMRRGGTTTRISMQQQKHGEKLNVPAGKAGLKDTHTHTRAHKVGLEKLTHTLVL